MRGFTPTICLSGAFMARESEKTSPFTDAELEAYSNRFLAAHEAMEDFRRVAKAGKHTTMHAFRRASLDEGLRRCESFLADLAKAKFLLISGKRLGPKSRKADL